MNRFYLFALFRSWMSSLLCFCFNSEFLVTLSRVSKRVSILLERRLSLSPSWRSNGLSET